MLIMWVIFLLATMIIFVSLFAILYIGNKFLIGMKKDWDKAEKEMSKEKGDNE